MKATCFCVLLLAAVISADLQSDINDILSQFPENQHMSSEKDVPNTDSQPQQQKPNKSNDLYEQWFEISEVKDLVDFFERRGIDIKELVLNLASNPNKYRIPKDIFTSGDVISNMMKALSSPKIAEMIKEKEASSPDFESLVEALKDPEFKILFYRILNLKASLNEKEQQERGFFKKIWKKALAHGISVSIPFAG